MNALIDWIETELDLTLDDAALARSLRDNGVSSFGSFRLLAHLEDEYDLIMEVDELRLFLSRPIGEVLALVERKLP